MKFRKNHRNHKYETVKIKKIRMEMYDFKFETEFCESNPLEKRASDTYYRDWHCWILSLGRTVNATRQKNKCRIGSFPKSNKSDNFLDYNTIYKKERLLLNLLRTIAHNVALELFILYTFCLNRIILSTIPFT